MVANAVGYNEDLRIMMTLQANAIGVSNVLKSIKTLRFEMDKLQSRYRGLNTMEAGTGITGAITESLGNRAQWRGPLDGIVEQAQKSFASKGGSAGQVLGQAITSGLDDELVRQNEAIARATKSYNKEIANSKFKSLGQAGDGSDLGQIFEIDEFSQKIRDSSKQVAKFNFAWLGVMFAGMELQRVFGGLFKSMMQGYRDAQASNSAFNTTMSRLGAQFGYVKFLFMDAFVNSPLFSWAIESAQWLLDKIAKLPDGVKAWTVGLILALAVLGTTLFVIGQINLGIQAIAGAKLFTGIVAFGKSVSAVAGRFAIILAAVLVIARLIQKAVEFSYNWKDAFWFVANELTIGFWKALQVVNQVMKAIGYVITTVVGGAIDIVFSLFKQYVNNLLDSVIRLVRSVASAFPMLSGVANRIANTLSENKFETVWGWDITKSGWQYVDKIFDKTDDQYQSHIDRLSEVNRMLNERNWLESQIDAGANIVSNPWGPQQPQVNINTGDVYLEGGADPSLIPQYAGQLSGGLFEWYEKESALRYGSNS